MTTNTLTIRGQHYASAAEIKAIIKAELVAVVEYATDLGQPLY